MTAGAGRALHAWVDESAYAPTTASPGMYLLAAAVADPADCASLRQALQALLLGRTKRLHWYDEPVRRRRLIAEAVAGLGLSHTVVVGAPLNRHKLERARRKCMERLLFELAELSVSRAWLESRTQRQDAQDRTMVAALHSARTIPAELFIDFAKPSHEPMLWLPDVIAGAVGLARYGGDRKPRELLAAQITEHQIELD